MLRCIFLWFSEEACPKDDLFDYFKVFLLVMKEKTLFWKDRLVMPLDMAIKMLNLKMLTNVYNTYYFLFFICYYIGNCFFDNI
jgi:hypothetical protein